MTEKPVSRTVVVILVAIALLLAISLVVILAVAFLIGKMGDVGGQTVLQYVALGLGLAWVVDLVCLVLATGVNSLCDGDSSGHPPTDDNV